MDRERYTDQDAMPGIDKLESHLHAMTDHAAPHIQIVRSPLRISPLGAHVDHQDGLVTGMTLDRAIVLAFAPRTDRRMVVESLNVPLPVGL